MPQYEYRCKDCGHVFTALVKLDRTDKPKHCPECLGKLERIMSVPGKADVR